MTGGHRKPASEISELSTPGQLDTLASNMAGTYPIMEVLMNNYGKIWENHRTKWGIVHCRVGKKAPEGNYYKLKQG